MSNLNLKYCGQGVKIYPQAMIVKPEVVEIGAWSQLDDFSFLLGGKGITIGNRVHIAHFASIVGGGKCTMGDYSALAAGVRLITGTDLFNGEGMTNPCIPEEFRAVERGLIKIEKHAVLGTNAIVLPNVTIGEGAIVVVGSIVIKDCEPWVVYGGSPARPIKKRPREKILNQEKQLIKKYGV